MAVAESATFRALSRIEAILPSVGGDIADSGGFSRFTIACQPLSMLAQREYRAAMRGAWACSCWRRHGDTPIGFLGRSAAARAFRGFGARRAAKL